MKFKRFTTDRRLWLWISLTLFVISWFLPFDNVKGGWVFRPGFVVFSLFLDRDFLAGLFFASLFSLLFCIPAVVGGWIIQCIVVMIRGRRHLP